MNPEDLSALWAPWRVEYFKTNTGSPDFLLAAAQATDDAAHLVVARKPRTFLIMNRYPYAVGHLMAVPVRKVAEIDALTADEKM
ncbi:MAG TPA: HIT family hydrolase, partial [Chthoniobacteraceae bacterium]|nr:HIT family hydrolase [Chthoniobacteraceae bacterium]